MQVYSVNYPNAPNEQIAHVFNINHEVCNIGDEIWYCKFNSHNEYSVVPVRGRIHCITLLSNSTYPTDDFFKHFIVSLLNSHIKFNSLGINTSTLDRPTAVDIYSGDLPPHLNNMIAWGLRENKLILHYDIVAFDTTGDCITKFLSSEAVFKTQSTLEDYIQMWNQERRMCTNLKNYVERLSRKRNRFQPYMI